jgi:IstB-like ATP binding protein
MHDHGLLCLKRLLPSGCRAVGSCECNCQTLADGILDRLVHNAHRIELHGDSMRKTKTAKTDKLETPPASQP